METLQMGVAERDITPSGPIETIGFGRGDEWSRGVLHKLWVQAAVIRHGEERGCMITLDHIGFSRQHAEELRDAVGWILSVSREKVMLCFSHGHSSPNESLSPEYYHFVCEQVKDAVSKAAQNMVNVRAVWGNAYTDIGLNRRGDDGALDRRIGILKVCRADSGEPFLLLLRLTAHGNVLKEDNYLISPDYFGTVRDVLADTYHCPVMVTQGAAGNVSPKYFKSSINPPDAGDDRFIRADDALERMARTILRDAGPVIEGLYPKAVSHFSMYSQVIELQADVPSCEEALRIAEEARRFCGIDGTGWLGEVESLNRNHTEQQTETVEVQYLTIDEGCLCGVPNEVMVELALSLSDILHNDRFYFGGYTNGCTGYLPTEEEFDKGGYEVYWSMLLFYLYHGRVFPLRRDSASKLVHFTAENYRKR